MLFKHIIGEITFKATGDNPLKFINDIKKSEFSCKGLYSKNNDVYATIYGVNFDKLSKIAKDNYMQIEKTKKSGLVYHIAPYRKRIGLIAGIVFSIVMIFFLSNTAIKIEIIGCDEELHPKIYSALELYGLTPGSFIPSLDFDKIETDMLSALDEISWIGIRSKGGVIIVSVNSSTAKPDMLKKRMPCDIVATKDAQIISLQVYAGQLTVLIGDGVKKGEILVSGISTDKYGKISKVHSHGSIIGQYEETIEFIQPFFEEIKTISSDTERKRYLNFFSVKIPLFIGKEPQGECSISERKNSFSLFTLKTPLGITHKSFTSYSVEKYYYSSEEARIQLDKKIEIYETNFLLDKTIISKDIFEKEDENSITYTVRYVVQGEIGQASEILIKN